MITESSTKNAFAAVPVPAAGSASHTPYKRETTGVVNHISVGLTVDPATERDPATEQDAPQVDRSYTTHPATG